jgi:hypothetical protein
MGVNQLTEHQSSFHKKEVFAEAAEFAGAAQLYDDGRGGKGGREARKWTSSKLTSCSVMRIH